MDKRKRKALEDAGFKVGTVQEFLGLTDEENQVVELRVAIALRIRKLRAGSHLTQQQLAAKVKSSQSRIAKVEAASPDVSLDLLFRTFFASGGKLTDLAKAHARTKAAPPRLPSPKRSKAISSRPSSPQPAESAPRHASPAVAKPKSSKAKGGLVGGGVR